MAEDKRIPQLPRAATTAKQGVFAIVDPITDQTVQIAVQAALGATRASFDWQSDTTYSIGDLRLYNGLTVWRSLQNNNTGNVPTEGAWWTQETISTADGITDTAYSSGVFTYESSKVIYNNAQYYLQTAAPFKSTDIVTEIGNGDWAAAVVGATGITTINAATYTVLTTDQILSVLYTITGAATITIPTSLITAGFNKLVIKDTGGNSQNNNITIIGGSSELIDGSTSLIINGNYAAVNLYSDGTAIYIY